MFSVDAYVRCDEMMTVVGVSTVLSAADLESPYHHPYLPSVQLIQL